MKTYKNLYPQICTFENLFLAYHAAARGKRGKPEVAAFEQYLEPNLFRLQEELLTQTYQPGPYTHFPIRDPKPRVISAAPFRDRVVHHALVRVIEPIFEARFIHDSYACRVGKGTFNDNNGFRVVFHDARHRAGKPRRPRTRGGAQNKESQPGPAPVASGLCPAGQIASPRALQ